MRDDRAASTADAICVRFRLQRPIDCRREERHREAGRTGKGIVGAERDTAAHRRLFDRAGVLPARRQRRQQIAARLLLHVIVALHVEIGHLDRGVLAEGHLDRVVQRQPEPAPRHFPLQTHRKSVLKSIASYPFFSSVSYFFPFCFSRKSSIRRIPFSVEIPRRKFTTRNTSASFVDMLCDSNTSLRTINPSTE